MDSFHKLPLFLFLLLTLITSTHAISQPCTSYKFPNNAKFSACNDLPVLDSSIHWNYHSASSSIVEVAFKKNNPKQNSWIAWAINPTSKGMVGCQAFVAYKKSDGSMAAYTSPLTSYGTKLEEGRLSFDVDAVSASFVNDALILFASFRLPAGNSSNSSVVNHVWQEGSVSEDDVPMIHALSGPNVKSFGQLDLVSGSVVSDNGGGNFGESRILIRKVHGILNGLGWGILMPVGVMLARYLKAFDNASSTWFFLHRVIQILAYFMGMAGFALGIYMGNHFSSIHGYLGIAIFSSATAQIFVAIFFRPNKDHKNRIFWNIFHYIVGYGVVALSIFNMFRGFSISNSYKMWKNVYFGVIVSLGCIAVVLEVVTWVLVCKRKMKKKEEKNFDHESSHKSNEDEQIP